MGTPIGMNLWHLNKFLDKQRFKYKDIYVAMLLFKKGDYIFSFHLKSGYHHIDIAQVHYKYLGFACSQRYYMFTMLPFGLCTACYLFTTVMWPLVHYWRTHGLSVVVYLDDELGAASGMEAACRHSEMV